MAYYPNVNDDCVSGEIVGDVYAINYQIFYDGRPQSGRLWAKDYVTARADAIHRVDKLKAENVGVCYQKTDLWEMRVFQNKAP